MPPSAQELCQPQWVSASTSRKRFFERKEEKDGGVRKKRKISHHDDDLSNELWEEAQDNLQAIERFSSSIDNKIITKNEPTECNENIIEEKIDLLQESEKLKGMLKDCSAVKLLSLKELKEKQEIRKKRIERIKYDEVVRVKKTREQMPAHQCEMCQKVSLLFILKIVGKFLTNNCSQFYDALDDDLIDKSALILNCSRHRYNYSPPPTPPGFWDVSLLFITF